MSGCLLRRPAAFSKICLPRLRALVQFQNNAWERAPVALVSRHVRVGGKGISILFAEDGVTVPGGSGADKLCPAESRAECGGEGGAGG